MPSFISATVDPLFDTTRALGRRQMPDAFLWHGERYEIVELLSFWTESGQPWWQQRQWRGRRQHVSSLGRDYYRVRTGNGRIFDLYYDRRMRGRQLGGLWVLWREWREDELADTDKFAPDAL